MAIDSMRVWLVMFNRLLDGLPTGQPVYVAARQRRRAVARAARHLGAGWRLDFVVRAEHHRDGAVRRVY